MVSERERIAHDVHDVLGHSLTVITLKADLARKLLHADPDRADAELEAIAQLSRSSLAEVRSTVTRLRIPDFSGEFRRRSVPCRRPQLPRNCPMRNVPSQRLG